jgi:hypothetical protein
LADGTNVNPINSLKSEFFINLLLSGLVSGSVMAALLGMVLARKTDLFRSRRTWKERSIADLLGPIYMQFERTKRAFKRYDANNTFLEAKVIREGNVTIRDLLLKNTHLVPPDLLEDAARLVEHYDRWLEEYEKLRSAESPDLESPFVFVGPKGFLFPRDAEERFKATFKKYWHELYAEPK